MSKKKPRPSSANNQVAQNLIDGLLDDKSTAKPVASNAPDSPTASIVIDLQEKIDERTNATRTKKKVDDTAEFSLSKSDDKLELANPNAAKVLDPVARAMQNAKTQMASQSTTVSPTRPTATATDPDERTMAVAPPTSRTVNPKTMTEPSPKAAAGAASATARGQASAVVDFGTLDRMMPTEIKTPGGQTTRDTKQKVAGPSYAPASSAGAASFGSTDAALKQSESLRVAQKRITELEQELERLRRENENLSTAGETLRRRADELLTKTEQLDSRARESEKIHENEKHIYRGQLNQKDREIGEYRSRVDEMEGRLENNFKKIRVRERELEHRLEIIKMESATLIATKDKMLLDLKRQIDQLAHENAYGKQKSAELFNQFKGKQETIRRVVRALRIALTILEGDEDAAPSSAPSKKDP